jgi:hypothetical protein
MRMLADKLQKLGVNSSFEVVKGFPHFFWMLPMMAKSQEFMSKWAEEIRQMVA